MRVSNQLDTDGGTLTLTTRNTLYKRASDLGVLTLIQSELLYDLVNSLQLLGVSTFELQFGSKLEALADRHRLEEDIVLLHVGGESREVPAHLTPFHTIDEDLALFIKVLTDLTTRQII